MTIRRLIVPLTVALAVAHAGHSFAQGAFPAPLPGQASPPVNDPAFPPVNGAAPTATIVAPPGGSFPATGVAPLSGGSFAPAPPSQAGGPPDCMKEFLPLREEAEKRGKLIKEASEKHASAEEACKLIGSFGVAELKMIKFVESHAAKCGIPPQISEQLKSGHKNTEGMQKKVCQVAQQQQQRAPAGPSLSDVLGSAAQLPDAKAAKRSGGSTFDTLNGNVLAR